MRSVKMLGCMMCGVGILVAAYAAVSLATGGGHIPRETIRTILVLSGVAPVAGWGILRLKRWAWLLGLVLFAGMLIVGASWFMLSLALVPQQGQTEYLVSGTVLVCAAAAGLLAVLRSEVKQQIWLKR